MLVRIPGTTFGVKLAINGSLTQNDGCYLSHLLPACYRPVAGLLLLYVVTFSTCLLLLLPACYQPRPHCSREIAVKMMLIAIPYKHRGPGKWIPFCVRR
jgi:hypothetical protein